jgi:peptidoglycan/LPS O-acetylase OafA/YrhL
MQPETIVQAKKLNEKIFFPNLNGIRFVAAILVIVHHIEQFKYHLGLSNYWSVPSVYLIGKLGVVLFFVLSGFLITYLLMTEEKKTGDISVKNFYIRRMLRIWPLYYLVVLVALLLIPAIAFFDLADYPAIPASQVKGRLLLFLIFLPNLANIVYPSLPYIAQAWSVGVEEQFYLIWPLLMKKIKNKKYLLAGVIIIYLLIKITLYIISITNPGNNYLSAIFAVWDSFSIDCMAIGGITAYLLFKKRKLLTFLFQPWLQVTVMLLICLLIARGVVFPFIHYEVYGILFAVMILNLASNHHRIFKLENKYMDYLGKISYGLYMYHPIAIMVSLKMLIALKSDSMVLQYITSISLTILISAISYQLYEEYFIRKKLKFTKIISGDNVKI